MYPGGRGVHQLWKYSLKIQFFRVSLMWSLCIVNSNIWHNIPPLQTRAHADGKCFQLFGWTTNRWRVNSSWAVEHPDLLIPLPCTGDEANRLTWIWAQLSNCSEKKTEKWGKLRSQNWQRHRHIGASASLKKKIKDTGIEWNQILIYHH